MINFEKEWNQNSRLLKFEIIEQLIMYEFSTFHDALTTVIVPLADINSSAHICFLPGIAVSNSLRHSLQTL